MSYDDAGNRAPQEIPVWVLFRLVQWANGLDAQLPEDMTDYQWVVEGKPIRELAVDLSRLGEDAGVIEPYMERLPDGRVEIGSRAVQGVDLNALIDLNNPSGSRGFDSPSFQRLRRLAILLMESHDAPSGVTLPGPGAIQDMWDYLYENEGRPGVEEASSRAWDTFISTLQDLRLVEVNQDGFATQINSRKWQGATMELPDSFWADYYVTLLG